MTDWPVCTFFSLTWLDKSMIKTDSDSPVLWRKSWEETSLRYYECRRCSDSCQVVMHVTTWFDPGRSLTLWLWSPCPAWVCLGTVEIIPLRKKRTQTKGQTNDTAYTGNGQRCWPHWPRRPPYPQPMSANSTRDISLSDTPSVKKSGYSWDQSISSGHTGLQKQEVQKKKVTCTDCSSTKYWGKQHLQTLVVLSETSFSFRQKITLSCMHWKLWPSCLWWG